MGNNESKMDCGLLVIRLFFIGLIFHGLMKLMNIPGTTGFFGAVGIPLPGLFAYVEPLVETLGGLFVVLGVDTLVSGVLIALSMLVAIIVGVIPHLGKGGAGPAPTEPLAVTIMVVTSLLGLEAAYGLTALGLAFTGPGKYSLKKMMKL